MKKISSKCLSLVKEFEGCRLTAYRDEVGVWTIGYGITNSDFKITKKIIRKGTKISKATAEKWLEESLNKKYLPLVLEYDKQYNWNQNELDALVSFCYNIGSIKQLTANGTRSKAVVASKMLLYNKAGGKVYRGLTRRRKAERELFLTPVKEVKKKANKKSNTEVAKEVISGKWGTGATRKKKVTCSHHLRSGGFPLKNTNVFSINGLTPFAQRFSRMIEHPYLGYFTHRRKLGFRIFDFSVQPHISSYQCAYHLL